MATVHVVATTVARDALSGLAVDDLVLNKETGETTRWDGSKHVLTLDRTRDDVLATALGAAPTSNRVGAIGADAYGALMASMLAALAYIDEGKVASASNNDNGHVSLTKSSSLVTWDPAGGIGVTKWVEVLRSGTATGAQTSGTLQDTGYSAPNTDEHASALIRLSGGTGRGQVRSCRTIAFGSGLWTLDPKFPWDTTPIAGDTQYEILATRAQTAGLFNDTGKSFEVVIIEGAGQGQWRHIVGHTGTKLYLDRTWDAGHVPDSTSRFRIVPGALTTTRFLDKAVVWPAGSSRVDLARGWLDAWRSVYGPRLKGSGKGLTNIQFHGGYAEHAVPSMVQAASTFVDGTAAWTTDRWKNRYLVWHNAHGNKMGEARIKSNSATQLNLDQSAWPPYYTGSITSLGPNNATLNDTGLNLAGIFEDYVRFYSVRMTSGAATGEVKEIVANNGLGAIAHVEVVSAFGGALSVGDTYVIENRPTPLGTYLIAEECGVEFNGVAGAEIEGVTFEASGAELKFILANTWRRCYDGSNRANDFSEDVRRAARSNSSNIFRDVEVRGGWVDVGIMDGNYLKGANYQVDINRWENCKVYGIYDVNSSARQTKCPVGFREGAGLYGNNVIHSIDNPSILACKAGIELSLTDLRLKGGLIQSNGVDIRVIGVENYLGISDFRSEESRQFLSADYIGTKGMRVEIERVGFNVDGAHKLPPRGNLINWQLGGEVLINKVKSSHIDPSPVQVTVDSVAGAVVTYSGATRPLLAADMNGYGFVATVVSGTGFGQMRTINSVTGTTITLASAFGPNVAAGSVIEICEATVAPLPITFAAGCTQFTMRLQTVLHEDTYVGQRFLITSGAGVGSNRVIFTQSRDRIAVDDGPVSAAPAAGDTGLILRARFLNFSAGGSGQQGSRAQIVGCQLIGSPIHKAIRQSRMHGGGTHCFFDYSEMDRNGSVRTTWPGQTHFSNGTQQRIRFAGFSGNIFENYGAPPDVELYRSESGVLLVGGKLVIGAAGQAISTHRSGTAIWNPPTVAAGAQTTTTVAVIGAAIGDTVTVGFSQDLQGTQLTAYVSAPGVVTVVLRNGTAGAIDLASGTLRCDVWQH